MNSNKVTGDFRPKLMRNLVEAIKAFQDAVDLFDTTAATRLGINTTDLRCLTVLNDRGPLPASKVAQSLGITKGATTTALDRLEKAGYIERCVNAEDGRSFLIGLTAYGQREITAIWNPMRVQGQANMEEYSERELRLLMRFFTESVRLQKDCIATLRESEEPQVSA